jgi:ABC-2 type transport system ATP-binding protein
MTAPIVEITGLNYYFGRQKVLDNLHLQIPQGSIYGILGPNGAGKTTTLFLLLGILRKQEGDITIFGKDMTAHRVAILKRTGALVEQPSLYQHLSGRENLEIFRRSYDCPRERINTVLEMVEMTAAAPKKVSTYSLGMKQRIGIAVALLADPELLILDEPTNGLDPAGIIAIRTLIKTLREVHGKTIILSSHLLSEVEKLATDIAIIHKGRLLHQGPMDPAMQSLESLFIQLTADHLYPQRDFV